MMDPSKRFVSLVLVAGIVVLIAAISLGERMGERGLGGAQHGNLLPTVVVTPEAPGSLAPYGPNWKREQAIAAAPDPRFPDPRVPPEPLPTPIPRPRPATPTPAPTPSINPNIPIWDQRPFPKLPTPTPLATEEPVVSSSSPP